MKCPHCGRNEANFAPPCFGDPGFYLCMTPDEVEGVFKRHDEEVLRDYHPSSPKYLTALARTEARIAEEASHE